MPVIKARTRGKHVVRYITRLDRETHETLFAYAAFLGEPPDYVLNQLIDTVLARDKEFLAWREAHPGSHAPRPAGRRARRHASAHGARVCRIADRARAPPAACGVMTEGPMIQGSSRCAVWRRWRLPQRPVCGV